MDDQKVKTIIHYFFFSSFSSHCGGGNANIANKLISKKKKKRLIKLIELRRTKGQCSLIIDQLNIFD